MPLVLPIGSGSMRGMFRNICILYSDVDFRWSSVFIIINPKQPMAPCDYLKIKF